MRNHPAGMETSGGTGSCACAPDGEDDVIGGVGSMALERPQFADDVFDCILLEYADAGDAGCSGVQARRGVFQRDSAESEHGDVCAAVLLQNGSADRLRSWSIVFFKYRSADRKVGQAGLG